MKLPLKWAFRRNFASLGLLPAVEYAQLFSQLFLGRIHEPEFAAFSKLVTGKPVLDIGANSGQSAISIHNANPHLKVISFEPNKQMVSRLAFTKKLLGRSFEFHSIGLGEVDARIKIFIPISSGVVLSQEATYDKDLLVHDKLTRSRISAATGSLDFEISESEIEVQTLDSLKLDPGALKIDVQGLELEVLKGGIETLKRNQPFIMVESVPQNDEITDFLQPLGYSRFRFDLETKCLTQKDDRSIEPRQNWFYIHDLAKARFV